MLQLCRACSKVVCVLGMVIFALVACAANAFADSSYTFSVCSDVPAGFQDSWTTDSSANGQYTIGSQHYNRPLTGLSTSERAPLSGGDSCYGILWNNAASPQTSQDLGSLSVSGPVWQSYVSPRAVNDSGDAVGMIDLCY